MEDFNKTLDGILLNKNVVEKFYESYNDPDFFLKLNEVLPEVEQCRIQTQRGPWHLYNVLDHILHSVEHMNDLTKDLSKDRKRLLAYTMFFHDLGKPACHEEKIKNGEINDSFHGHNLVSMQILARAKDQLNLSEKDFQRMTWLIKYHDIFSDFIGKNKEFYEKIPLNMETIEKMIDDAEKYGDGMELMQNLELVGRADNYSQNREMTKPTLAKIETYAELLGKIKVKE